MGMAAASFWAFNPYIHATVYKLGLETPLAAFGIVLLLYKFSQFEKDWRTKPVTPRQIIVLALCAVIAMFSRLDLVFLAVICGFWVVFRGKLLRALLPLDILIIFVSMTSSVALRTSISQYNSTYAASAVEAVILVLAFKIISLYFLGAYQHPRMVSVWGTIRQTTLAVTVGSVVTAVFYIFLVQIGIGKSFPAQRLPDRLGYQPYTADCIAAGGVLVWRFQNQSRHSNRFSH